MQLKRYNKKVLLDNRRWNKGENKEGKLEKEK
jgi:hypothetical protein